MYLKRPEYVQRIQTRAEPYLFSIVEQIEYNRMPGEIALLPVVESAFQPNAYSHAHAAGIWQFIPSTGKIYGLQQNWWYDGRRDIHASDIRRQNSATYTNGNDNLTHASSESCRFSLETDERKRPTK